MKQIDWQTGAFLLVAAVLVIVTVQMGIAGEVGKALLWVLDFITQATSMF